MEALLMETSKLHGAEATQIRVLFWGSFLIAIATCAAVISSCLGMPKFSGFICAVVILLIYIFLLLFQLVMNGELNKFRKTCKMALEKKGYLREKSIDYIATCLI